MGRELREVTDRRDRRAKRNVRMLWLTLAETENTAGAGVVVLIDRLNQASTSSLRPVILVVAGPYFFARPVVTSSAQQVATMRLLFQA